MAGATRSSRTAQAAGKAGDAIAAEREALKALAAARNANDFARMAGLIDGLRETRLARVKAALESKRITIVDTPVSDDMRVSKGCYLVQPPQVGADARRLRLAAFEQGVAAVVLCREPLTQLKLVPVVALSPGVTIRTKVRPPRNLDNPDIAWFLDALEALGASGMQMIDASQPASRRVDGLLDCLDAVPEHEGLHHALQQACLEAQTEHDHAKSRRAARQKTAAAETGDEDDLDDSDETPSTDADASENDELA